PAATSAWTEAGLVTPRRRSRTARTMCNTSIIADAVNTVNRPLRTSPACPPTLSDMYPTDGGMTSSPANPIPMTQLIAVPAILGTITDARPTDVGNIGPMPIPASTIAQRTVSGDVALNAMASPSVVMAEPATSNTRLLTRTTPSRKLD